MRDDDERTGLTGDEGTAEEQAAADALALAVGGEGGSTNVPTDALETAALLRYSRDGGALPTERRQALLDEILAEARWPSTHGAPGPTRRWWASLLAGGTAAAAVALLLLMLPPVGGAPSALPPPPVALLRAQGEAVRGSADALEVEMRSYRHDLYAALSREYGVAP